MKQSGFTFIEILVTVAILALLSTVVILALSGVEGRADEKIVEAELVKIREAVLRFKRDMGASPRYLAELLQSPDPSDPMGGWWWRSAAEQPPTRLHRYDPATRRGWSGPYLEAEDRSSEGRESRVSSAVPYVDGNEAADQSVDSNGPARLALLLSDFSSYHQSSVSGRRVSHYQLVFNDPSGEVVVRFLRDPSASPVEVVERIRLGVRP